MAYIVEPDVVKYACTCGLLKPISRLYFCRHCLDFRCEYCVSHEVDSHFCGKCLENLPSNEARVKKNRCGNCVECPSCHQQLSSRAATTGPRNPEDPNAAPRKVVYLMCLNCRWSTRDVGIPDQPMGNNSWPERESIYADRLYKVQDAYKAMEKQQKLEKDKFSHKKYMNLTDRTGLTASVIRKRLGLPDVPHPLLKNKPKPPEPSVAKEEVEELPENIFYKPIMINEVTRIDQRLALPDWQPATVDKLYPAHKQLLVKRTLRCRSCEHNVIKPEINPNNIKFKIQLLAFYHIPEIRIVTVEPLRANKECELLIKFINPTQQQTSVRILPLDYVKEEIAGEEEKASLASEGPVSLTPSHPSFTRHPSQAIAPRKVEQTVGADIAAPESEFVLPLRDDAAEYDETADSQNIQDDPKLVVFRKANKAVIRLVVTPRELNLGDEVVAGFTMKHIYTNTLAVTMENRAPDKHPHYAKVFLSLGKLVGSE